MSNSPFPQPYQRSNNWGNIIITLLALCSLGYAIYRFIPTNVITVSPKVIPGLAYTVGQKIDVTSTKDKEVSNEFTVASIDQEYVTVKDVDGNTVSCTLSSMVSLEAMLEGCSTVSMAHIEHVSMDGYHISADGKQRPKSPTGVYGLPDCAAQGMRVWVVLSPVTGDPISYHCAP